MRYHLIVGFGKWSKKNLDYLRNKKKLKNIVIKTRDKFIYPNLKVLSKADNNKIVKKIDTIHICTPVESHFKYLKKFKHLKKVIVEKPIVKKKKEFKLIKKIYKKRYFIVNYIDTFNPIINKAENFLKKNTLKNDYDFLVVDFHGEITSEKMAIGHFFDGKATLVIGTHTHVPTNDARVLENGTAYQTDAGMCGNYNSVIGMDKLNSLKKFFKNKEAKKHFPANGEASLCGVIVDANIETGLANEIENFIHGGDLKNS